MARAASNAYLEDFLNIVFLRTEGFLSFARQRADIKAEKKGAANASLRGVSSIGEADSFNNFLP